MLALVLSTLLLSSPTEDASPVASNTFLDSSYHEIEVEPRSARVLRPWLVAGEFGINGLTGIGVNVGYNLNAYLSLDAGAGTSTQLARIGVRLRYNIFKANLTPFLGAGFLYGFGTPYDIETTFQDNAVRYRIESAPMAQGVAGLAWTHSRGFTLLASLGWAQLVTSGSNVHILSGRPTAIQKKNLNFMGGSGPVAALAIGYSF